jgi:hypothetical protein
MKFVPSFYVIAVGVFSDIPKSTGQFLFKSTPESSG